MTYRSLVAKLTECGAGAPEYEASEMLRVLCGLSREWCMMHQNDKLPPDIDDALRKRAEGIPLQYVLGEAWFYGNRFIVTPDCLIPQPDTEHCVALALENCKNAAVLLDLCTGSGCIAISILKENASLKGTAVDISAKALDIARQNSQLNGVADRLTFDICDVLSDDLAGLIADADIITSNPPYINTDVISTLSAEVRREPHIALDGGEDGMMFYRHFILNLTKHMKPSAVMLLEIGYDQADRIAALCEDAGLTCKIHKDFGGNPRISEIRRGKCEISE